MHFLRILGRPQALEMAAAITDSSALTEPAIQLAVLAIIQLRMTTGSSSGSDLVT